MDWLSVKQWPTQERKRCALASKLDVATTIYLGADAYNFAYQSDFGRALNWNAIHT